MDLAKLNPFVRYAGNPINLKPRNCRSLCYDCRLFFIKEGRGSMEIGTKQYDFRENTLLYLPPRSDYRFLPSRDASLSVLVFNFDLVSDFFHRDASLGTAQADLADLSVSPDYPIPEAFASEITGYLPQLLQPLEQCIRAFLTKAPYCRESASVVIKSALLDLLKCQTPNREQRIAEQVTEYIHSHFQEPELTNAQIAEHFGYHPYYLSQRIKATTGRTLHNYLLNYRLRMAKNFLITTDWDIESVSWKSGFNSVSYFIKMFRRNSGTTPRNYRQAHRNQVF